MSSETVLAPLSASPDKLPLSGPLRVGDGIFLFGQPGFPSGTTAIVACA